MDNIIEPYKDIKLKIDKEPLKYNDYLQKAIDNKRDKIKLKNLIVKVWDNISTLYPTNKEKPFQIVVERCRYEGLNHRVRVDWIGNKTKQKAIDKQNYYKKIQKQQIIEILNYLNK